MFDIPLPHIVSPIRLAKKRERLVGYINLDRFGRLNKIWPQPEDAVANIDLSFCFDEANKCCIVGDFKAIVNFYCQRCLAGMSELIHSEFTLTPISDSGMEKLNMIENEPIVLVDKKLNISKMIEDEILLTIPYYPKHEDSNCISKLIKH